MYLMIYNTELTFYERLTQSEDITDCYAWWQWFLVIIDCNHGVPLKLFVQITIL